MLRLDQRIWIVPRQEEMALISCLPNVFVSYAFRFVVDIVYPWIDWFAVFRILQVENRESSQIVEMQAPAVVIFFSHPELGLPHNATDSINHIILLAWTWVIGIAVADQIVFVWVNFPHIRNADRRSSEPMEVGQGVSNLDGRQLSCGLFG